MFDRDPHLKRRPSSAGPSRPASTLVQRDGPTAYQLRRCGRPPGTDPVAAVVSQRSHRIRRPRATAGTGRRAGSVARVASRRVSPDARGPARRPGGTRAPRLADDGSNLARPSRPSSKPARAGAEELGRAVAGAFDGASLSVLSTGGLFELQMHQPGMRRPLRITELSDGTPRFLLWAAALLAPDPRR